MRVLMVCMTNPKEGLKGDTKLVKKRREILEDMGCIVDVLYFRLSWNKSSVTAMPNESGNGIDVVAKISALSMVRWLTRAKSVIASEAVQTWVSFGIADVLRKNLEYIFGSYTVIHFYHIRSAGLWKLVPTGNRVIADVIDSYTLNLGNRIDKEKHRWKRALVTAEYNRIKRMEANIEKYFADRTNTTIVAVAEADIIHVGSSSSSRVVVPVGIKRGLLERTKRQQGKLRCVFFGNLDYEPNMTACSVIERATEMLKERGLERDVEITVGGRNISYGLKRRLERKKIRVVSPVEDMQELVRRHDLAVMPMVSGSGMQSKVLEAIAWGVVVLTTKRAAKPVGLVEDREYIRIDSAVDMVERIIDILNGKYDCERIRALAHERIKRFEWEKTCSMLLGLYKG